MRASYRTSCQPLRLRDRVAACCGALLKLYGDRRAEASCRQAQAQPAAPVQVSLDDKTVSPRKDDRSFTSRAGPGGSGRGVGSRGAADAGSRISWPTFETDARHLRNRRARLAGLPGRFRRRAGGIPERDLALREPRRTVVGLAASPGVEEIRARRGRHTWTLSTEVSGAPSFSLVVNSTQAPSFHAARTSSLNGDVHISPPIHVRAHQKNAMQD